MTNKPIKTIRVGGHDGSGSPPPGRDANHWNWRYANLHNALVTSWRDVEAARRLAEQARKNADLAYNHLCDHPGDPRAHITWETSEDQMATAAQRLDSTAAEHMRIRNAGAFALGEADEDYDLAVAKQGVANMLIAEHVQCHGDGRATGSAKELRERRIRALERANAMR